MMQLKNLMWGLLPVSLLLLSACQTTADQATETACTHTIKISNSLPGLLAQIEQTVGTPYADKLASCKLAAIGAKACGGPSSYLVYSTEASNEETLLTLVTRYNQLSHERNIREALISNCAVVLPPEVTLKDGICVITRTTFVDY